MPGLTLGGISQVLGLLIRKYSILLPNLMGLKNTEEILTDT